MSALEDLEKKLKACSYLVFFTDIDEAFLHDINEVFEQKKRLTQVLRETLNPSELDALKKVKRP